MNFFEKHKTKILIFFSVVCLLLMVLSMAYKFSPTYMNSVLGRVTTPIQRTFTKIGSWPDNIKSVGEYQEQNQKLEDEVNQLKLENNRLKILEKENKELNSLIELSATYSEFSKVPAQIIAKDVSNWYDTFLIDKGKKDLVEKDRAVIAPDGLVGRVIDSSENNAKVVAIIDDTSSVSAVSTRTDELGFVKGNFKYRNEGKCVMEFLDANPGILVGDEILTSHLSTIYPPGIIIGTVELIEVGADSSQKFAVIKPSVDFKNLSKVLVITDDYTKSFDDMLKE